ncbi:hypothetical protein [Okeania sp.]|uniref:hypothetical protein n=1 Tax=Okeania sp. TaxID=3100323 RepID=UPI002B4B0E95|nr:hypothetical protein [Okeania sp.]MEB3343056.1 hypothetical protein [Okeania sp.]
MNNETNKQVETFEEKFFDWLLSEPNSTEISTLGGSRKSMDKLETVISIEEQWSELDPLESEEIDFSYYDEGPPTTLGEVPTVYNRFESLLKKRLKAEIEAKPPLFPWEKPGCTMEYPEVDTDLSRTVDWFSQVSLWVSQIKNIKWRNLSLPLTDSVFTEILQSCQEKATSDLLPGIRLVRAVENLFPGQSQSLNSLAGLVLLGQARDGEVPIQVASYDTATPKQQMLLSLLAAKEILESLTLNCHLNQSVVTREWETTLGWINIEAEYSIPEDSSAASLRIKGELPAAASLKLQGGENQTISQSYAPGTLRVEIFNPQPEQKYELTIKLLDWEEPLKFTVCLSNG